MTPQMTDAAGPPSRRLCVYNGGFLKGATGARIRRILALSGYDVALGAPGEGDWVGVWGHSPTAPRGEKVSARTGAPVLRVEDAFLRSVLPGREGQPAIGLHLDTRGVHFDAGKPSDLERMLVEEPLDDTAILNRAKAAMARLKRANLSKYNTFDVTLAAPPPGYVLVIDQTLNDASVRASRADRNTFLEMLFLAREENPRAPIVIKTHPESQRGHRDGHFRAADLSDNMTLYSDPISPHALLEGATRVYTVSSQLGFEAITAGHDPVVLGQPFYAGWGLSDDRTPVDRRQRRLTRAQLFAAAMILYPKWYCPYRDRLATLEETLDTLEAEVRAWREDHAGWVGAGMRLWKRAPLQQVFGGYRRMVFAEGQAAVRNAGRDKAGRDKAGPVPASSRTPEPGPAPTPAPAPDVTGTDIKAAGTPRRLMVWAGKTTDALDAAGAVRVEDGFLRSRGLGAELVPPLSLVLDDLGIYYDPRRPSRLEAILNDGAPLSEDARLRTERLVAGLIAARLTKYNLGGADTGRAAASGSPENATAPDAEASLRPANTPRILRDDPTRIAPDNLTRMRPDGLPQGRRILVPGQVEDDASIRLGAGAVNTNAALLAATRAANPAAIILYKPHPDVEAGLRPGIVADASAADAILRRTDAVAALDAVDEVWTMTSAIGFEALLRGKAVTCTGQPFYAGWGLTVDRGAPLPRRTARPDLITLAHAALIAYPRYHDPVTRRPCPPEIVALRLATGTLPAPSRANRLLAKLQGVFASFAPLWR